MDIEAVAERVSEVLDARLGDDLYAVGWYDGSSDRRTDVAYMNDRFTDAVSPGADAHAVLDDALLGRLGKVTHSMLDESAVASSTIYQSFVDVHVHFGDDCGVVVALDRDADVSTADVVETARAQAAGESAGTAR